MWRGVQCPGRSDAGVVIVVAIGSGDLGGGSSDRVRVTVRQDE